MAPVRTAFNVDVDELAMYRKFGATIDYHTLRSLWETRPEEETVQHYQSVMQERLDVSAVTLEQQRKVAELAAKFRAFKKIIS